MQLTTERLILTPMSSGDLEVFHTINTDPFVRKYLWDDEEIPIAVSEEILQEVEKRFREENWGLWKIESGSDKECLGYTGLWYFFDEDQPQLLFALLPQHAGKGYATEAARKIIDYAFNQLGYTYLIAATDPPNQASINACMRLGMKLVEQKEVDGKVTLFYSLDR